MSRILAMKRTWLAFVSMLAVAAIMAVGMPAISSQGADHQDAPSVQQDGRLDINDVYAFTSPTNPNNAVMIMTVNPAAGVLSPETFHPEARYELLIDNTFDNRADITYSFSFSQPRANGDQQVSVVGPGIRQRGTTGTTMTAPNGASMSAFLADDPFFFDLDAFRDNLNFCQGGTGTDFFAGLNVSAIVLEVPSSEIVTGSGPLGDLARIWGRTTLRGAQIDRMGRPGINTILIPGDFNGFLKDYFNITSPRGDKQIWKDVIATSLSNLGGQPGLADTLTPDVLDYNAAETVSSFGNFSGRALEDDVIDIALSLVSGGGLTTDCVDANDKPFKTIFPYLPAVIK